MHIGTKRNAALLVIGTLLFVGAWTGFYLMGGRYVPSPLAAANAAVTQLVNSRYFVSLGLPEGGFLPHLISTTRTTLLGCALGGIIGILTGLASAHSPIAFQIIRPISTLLGTIPILLAAPFFLIWFGVSDNAKLALVCIYSAAVLDLYTLRAVNNLHPSFGEYAQTLGARPFDVLLRVSFLGSVPELFGGLRTALSAAWGLTAITELLGTDRGIGRVIITTWGVQDVTTMVAGLLLLSLLAILCDAALMQMRAFATRWISAADLG